MPVAGVQRIADLADKRIAVWGCGKEGHAALAALQRYFPHRSVTVFCTAAEAADLRAHDAGPEHGLQIVTAPPDPATLAAFDVVI